MTGLLFRRQAWGVSVLLFLASLVVAVVPEWPSAEFQNALLEDATVAQAEATTTQRTRIATAGDSSMMFMNASIADALAGSWIPVPETLAEWTSGTGGLDRNGCGITGDQLDFYYAPDVGPRATRFNHAPVPESTCDWGRWIPAALDLSNPDVLVVSFGPSSMWGYGVNGTAVDLTDPELYSIMLAAHRDLETAARSGGVGRVVWIAYPPVVNTVIAEQTTFAQFATNPEVSDMYFTLLNELDGDVVDLRDLVEPSLYRDGTHFDEDGAAVAATRILSLISVE